ncbi:MAG: phosphoglycolate phosphatase [Gammaproteobacteria bacterium]|nr:phosphoglycolate phosphatase [Gammaproteobacteria bacterium]
MTQVLERLRSVFFDLDGTLADTAPDLAHVLNRLLQDEGHQPLAYEKIRVRVSHGSDALIQLGFGISGSDPSFEDLRQRFLALYRSHLANETRLYPGMETALQWLERNGMKWGVITNKPAWLTNPLLEELGLSPRAACIVSGDSVANRKPHPEPLLLACELLDSKPSQCVYVGDAQRDIRAGTLAGMRTLVALFGYIDHEEDPSTWGADGIIETPLDLIDWLSLNHAALEPRGS